MNTPVRILVAVAALAPLAAVPVSGGDLTPGAVMILGAPLLAVLRGRLQQLWLLALPVLSCAHLFALEPGSSGQLALFDYSLTVARVDKLSLAFGYIFGMAAVIAAIYALHLRDGLQHTCGAVYVGAATGAVFAGDLLTLFVYWELTSVASVFLVWAGGGERAFRAGMRYLLVQVGSGVLLLAGLIVRYDATGSLAFEHLGDPGTGNLGGTLIFLAFGIKCAFPLLHNWLQGRLPRGPSVTGTVVLSAFTTKLAVYSLARGFAGVEILVPIGTAMTVFPVFFAVIENDLRRVLAYSLNNQLGFMVVGIGIGTGLAMNGAVSHAFVHIIYKALLFMSVGGRALPHGHGEGLRARNALQVDALDRVLLPRRRRLDLGLSPVQRVRHQVDDPGAPRPRRAGRSAGSCSSSPRRGCSTTRGSRSPSTVSTACATPGSAAGKPLSTCCWRWVSPLFCASRSACTRSRSTTSCPTKSIISMPTPRAT